MPTGPDTPGVSDAHPRELGGTPLWVPETARTARDLPFRLRQVARHNPLMALRLIYQMFSNSSLFQRPSTLVGRRGGYCVELSLRRERPAAADYLDFRSSSAIHTESDTWAPIWS